MTLRQSFEAALNQRWFGSADAAPLAAPNPLLRLPIAVLAQLEPLVLWSSARAHAKIVRLPATARPAVLVVGNLVVGGTGKTPLTLAIAQLLRQHGYRVGLLANAYRARQQAASLVMADSTPSAVGDEALLLARHSGLPVVSGRRRDQALTLLLAKHSQLDVVIADDGLQHYPLARSLELAVFDARGVGNGHLLPAGPLRQRLDDAKSLDALLLNGTDTSPLAHPRCFRFDIEISALVPLANYRQDGVSAATPLAAALTQLRGLGPTRVKAIAGIAEPARFERSLHGIGLDCAVVALGDHARLSSQTLQAIDADAIVMTEKDAVKLLDVDDQRCWVAIVSAQLPHTFAHWLLAQPSLLPTALTTAKGAPQTPTE